MKPRGVLSFFAFFLAALSIGWGRDSSASPVTIDDIVGVWMLDPGFAREVAKQTPNAAPPEIEFQSGGRFEFVNTPKWWTNVFGQPAGKDVLGQSAAKVQGAVGKWTLIAGKDRPQLALDALGYSTVLGVDTIGGLRHIVLHVGDSNGANAVTFSRRIKNTK